MQLLQIFGYKTFLGQFQTGKVDALQNVCRQVRFKEINGNRLVLQGSLEKGIVFRLGDRGQVISNMIRLNCDFTWEEVGCQMVFIPALALSVLHVSHPPATVALRRQAIGPLGLLAFLGRRRN